MASVAGFAAPIANKGSLVKPVIDKEFPEDVFLPASKTVNAEIGMVIKTAVVPCVHTPVEPDLFGDCAGVLAKVFGDGPEGQSIIKRSFYVEPVVKR